MKHDYQMREDKIYDEEGNIHTVYGVVAIEQGSIIRSVSDVFKDKTDAEYYIGLFNSLQLSLCHLDDIIEEIL